MKKLIGILLVMGAMAMTVDASAATYIVKIGVDDDETGFVYEYNDIDEVACEQEYGSYCLRWKTDSLPWDVYGIYARIYKDDGAFYYWCDWDAFDEETLENNPDTTSTGLTIDGDRTYSMTHYWDEESQDYHFTDFARFDYKYNSSSPIRIRLFQVHEPIE